MLIEINDLCIVEYIRSLINNVQYFVAYVLNVSRIHPPSHPHPNLICWLWYFDCRKITQDYVLPETLDPFLFDLFSFVLSVIPVLKMQRVFHWRANQGTSLLQTDDCGQGVLFWPRHTDQLQPEPGGPVEGQDSILCRPASLSECGHPNNNRCYTWR